MHTANQPYNVLDGASKQKNPRKPEDLARLNRYASVLRSYCAAGDPVCAGGSIVADHLNYFELYTDEASSYVVSKIDAVAPLCPATSSSSAPSSVATSAAATTPGATTPAATVTATPTKTASSPADTTCSSSPVIPTFPAPIPYEEKCVQVVHIKYEYA